MCLCLTWVRDALFGCLIAGVRLSWRLSIRLRWAACISSSDMEKPLKRLVEMVSASDEDDDDASSDIVLGGPRVSSIAVCGE